MGNLRQSDKVEQQYASLKKSWNKYNKPGEKNALFKAVLHAFRCKNVFSIILDV